MMRLMLLRHAKADSGTSRLDDFARELTPRGREAAAQIGKWMVENGLFPDLVLVSEARRTQQTWDIVAPLAGDPAEVHRTRALYLATPGEILACLTDAATEARSTAPRCILIVGHNPGLETLAGMLAGPGSDRTAADDLARGYPTAGLGVFEIEAETWSELGNSPIRLVALMRPREP